MEDGLNLKGQFEVTHFGRDGVIKSKEKMHNVICTTGMALATAALLTDIAGAGAVLDYVGIGVGTSGAVKTDTGLASQHMRQAATGTQETTTSTKDTLQVKTLFTVTGNIAICEYAIFNAAAAGTVWARQTGGVHNMVNGETIEVSYKTVLS